MMKLINRRHILVVVAITFCMLTVMPSLALAQESKDDGAGTKSLMYIYIYDNGKMVHGQAIRIQIYHKYMFNIYQSTHVIASWNPSFFGYSDTRAANVYKNGGRTASYYTTSNVRWPGVAWQAPGQVLKDGDTIRCLLHIGVFQNPYARITLDSGNIVVDV